MWIGLLCVVGSYILSVCMLHVFNRSRKADRTYRLLLVTKDNQLHIEWYIRSLFFITRLSGKSISVTLIDEGSTDDTLGIAERLSKLYELEIMANRPDHSWQQWAESSQRDEIVIMHVSNQKQLVKLPLFE
ncbi:hypothetical protein [Paenibacillus sp. FJAT-26967]|uniref:hypothetical protein n=1 Tax=Paenibacillus sp. FJAT-26967 TaxID=1729690 RepID=UPI0008391008|nr:hypothetical protein [Paenibacillus sp. FJAT-26967]